jgi:hypothetical protein
MKPRLRVIIEQCVEEGTLQGYRRAHKHTDDPGEDAITEMITNAIMGRLYEWFVFDESD